MKNLALRYSFGIEELLLLVCIVLGRLVDIGFENKGVLDFADLKPAV